MADRKLEDEIEQIKSDFDTLRKDVGDLTSLLRDLGEEHLDTARDSARDSLEEIRERARSRAADIRGKGRAYRRNLDEAVEEHPERSLAIAFGVGFVTARLLGGGRL